GCSVDWDRVTFTMDDHYYKAVIKVFVDLYKKGLIYRGARMINWDPAAKTALSDEEVEYKDVTGKLYYIKYQVSGSSGHIVIATQRPETIMGDTAVCANPNDKRYTQLKGKKVFVPLINKEIPVIFDEYVDKDFGTGILKITPAHDINDFNIGLKHKLPVVDTLNEDGTLSEAAQIYVGEDRFAARKKIVADLKEKGLLVKEEEYTTRIGYSQRTNVVAEPKISTQWFVKMKEMAKPALEAVASGNITIHPGEKFNATYKYWLENVKDWCISRQLWWGQQIPAWYDEEGNVYVAESEEEVLEKFKKQKTKNKSETLQQDEDVLDTWFSSWLWPIEVFNGITDAGNKDINYYYPTSVLVTGQDIIFFWVARMIMAGMEYMHEKPFSDVYFTGMVRDKQGRKMSKSLGNSPDLLHLIHEYGADAVRFGIMISSPAGNDLLFDENSLEQGKFFNNKLWTALKLVKMWAARLPDDGNSPTSENDANNFAINWFENRLNEVRIEVDKLMSQFRLSEALKTIYSLIWDDFCSWYLEWIKPGFEEPIAEFTYSKTIFFFDDLLQILHPFMPFITEEIYHLLKERKDDLVVKQFALAGKTDATILQQGNRLKEIITAIRDGRNKHNIRQKEMIKLYFGSGDEKQYKPIENILVRQVNAESISFSSRPENSFITIVAGKEKIYIEVNIEIDKNVQKEKLLKDLDYLKGFLNSIDKKLTNDRF
ncbi:MAG: valine--tRNA ligase, partial [Ginsengibacter sp.]